MQKNSLITVIVIVIIIIAGGAWWYASSHGQKASVAPTQPVAVVASTTTSNDLVGTWVSTTPGKGMQGTGTITLPKSTTNFSISGDVNLVITKVENNIGSGTISYSNLCTTETTTYTTKPAVTKKLPCTSAVGKPIEVAIDGNKVTFNGQTSTGADISFTGSYTNDTSSGTVVVKGTYGDMTGSFSLTKAK